MTALPPMRREILAEVLKIIFLSGTLALFLIVSIYFSGKSPKIVFFINYKSMNSILAISDSCDSFFLAKNHLIRLRKKEVEDFELSLTYLENYFNNNDTIQSLQKIRELFENYKLNNKNFEYTEYIKMRAYLRILIKENQKINSKIIEDRESFATKVLILSCIVFLLSFLISVYFSEKLSGKIAQPIKKISEILQNQPILGKKLKFPQPENLEIKNLIIELNDFWKRLGELNDTNVKNLNAQRNELNTIFDTMDDAIFVLDHLGRIAHYNKVFSSIMGAKKQYLNFQYWNDVSLSSLSYIQLRNLLRNENFEEVDFFATVENIGRIYRVRKRIIYDANHCRCGIIYILHEITNTLSPEKFSEMSLKLQEYQSKYE